jgi:hypothetical protein
MRRSITQTFISQSSSQDNSRQHPDGFQTVSPQHSHFQLVETIIWTNIPERRRFLKGNGSSKEVNQSWRK